MASWSLFVGAVVLLVNILHEPSVIGGVTQERCSIGSRFTVDIGHNASGHWRTSLRMRKDSPAGQRDDGMTLDLQPSTTTWDGVRSDSLAVVIEGPPSASCVSPWSSPRDSRSPYRSVPEPVAVPVPVPPRPSSYMATAGFGYYKVHAEKVRWWEAHAACRAEGAHLLVIDSQAEADAVRRIIREQPRGFSEWMNVGYFSPNTNFVTIFGAPLSSVGYQKWGVDEPDMAVCGHMDQNMLYYDGQCDWVHAFICEYGEAPSPSELLENLPLPPISSGLTAISKRPVTTPPSNYTFLMRKGRDHYYKYHQELMTWWKAKETCEAEGAYLAVINSRSEADRLKEFIEQKPSTTSYMHIGVHAMEHFVTIYGDPLSSIGYKRWESEQPDDERCVVVNRAMLMFDGLCSYKTGFICEQDVA